MFLNVPYAGEYLVILETQQSTLHLVARVHQASVLIVWLQLADRLAAATVQAGEIHTPDDASSAVRSVNEGEYQFPQIWPALPYATLFAWPARGGIGAWDQIFSPDPQTQVVTLAETRGSVLDLRGCPVSRTPTPKPTHTPTAKPTSTPTAKPTSTPTTPSPTVTPTTPPTVTPTTPPVCQGVLDEGACWYLSALNAACQSTCQAEGLAVDTTIDAGGNFWDTHDATYCRYLLGRLQHPDLDQSTATLTIPSSYGLCGASNTGVVIKRDGGQQDATHSFNNGQVACPCR